MLGAEYFVPELVCKHLLDVLHAFAPESDGHPIAEANAHKGLLLADGVGDQVDHPGAGAVVVDDVLDHLQGVGPVREHEDGIAVGVVQVQFVDPVPAAVGLGGWAVHEQLGVVLQAVGVEAHVPGVQSVRAISQLEQNNH